MDKNYKHATDMEERLRRASDAAIVNCAEWRETICRMPPYCALCDLKVEPGHVAFAANDIDPDAPEGLIICKECADDFYGERRHGRDPVEDFNPTRWAVLSAVVILVIITLNVM